VTNNILQLLENEKIILKICGNVQYMGNLLGQILRSSKRLRQPRLHFVMMPRTHIHFFTPKVEIGRAGCVDIGLRVGAPHDKFFKKITKQLQVSATRENYEELRLMCDAI